MDELKQYLAKKVEDLIRDLELYNDFNGHQIEINQITPTEWMLRVNPLDPGAPRYFRVKISEAM